MPGSKKRAIDMYKEVGGIRVCVAGVDCKRQ